LKNPILLELIKNNIKLKSNKMPKRAEKVEDFENYQSFIATKLGNMK
jgi:hypothetical protein